jgi:hypothetical protein
MTMSPGLRRAVLTLHVVTSLGWLGSVIAYAAMDLTTAASRDTELVRAAYRAMDVIATSTIAPLAVASLLIGIANALGTPWGLFRHYWVLAKLLLTTLATTVLLLEIRTISSLADAASTTPDPRQLPSTLVHSLGGLLVLLLITTLSMYKPRGVTRYGWRRQQDERRRQQTHRATTLPTP